MSRLSGGLSHKTKQLCDLRMTLQAVLLFQFSFLRIDAMLDACVDCPRKQNVLGVAPGSRNADQMSDWNAVGRTNQISICTK